MSKFNIKIAEISTDVTIKYYLDDNTCLLALEDDDGKKMISVLNKDSAQDLIEALSEWLSTQTKESK